MYTRFTTPAIIFRKQNTGESDCRYSILTQDLGYIQATATSVRSLSSKLRYHAQLFMPCQIEVVRGRRSWRLVGIHTENIGPLGAVTLAACARMGQVIDRLVGRDEPQPELFSLCDEFVRGHISHTATVGVVMLHTILESLGYVAAPLPPGELSADDIAAVHQQINEALVASQL